MQNVNIVAVLMGVVSVLRSIRTPGIHFKSEPRAGHAEKLANRLVDILTEIEQSDLFDVEIPIETNNMMGSHNIPHTLLAASPMDGYGVRIGMFKYNGHCYVDLPFFITSYYDGDSDWGSAQYYATELEASEAFAKKLATGWNLINNNADYLPKIPMIKVMRDLIRPEYFHDGKLTLRDTKMVADNLCDLLKNKGFGK